MLIEAICWLMKDDVQIMAMHVWIQRGYLGVRTPWKITSYIGFYRNKHLDPPPWKMLDPLNYSFLWNNHWTPSVKLSNKLRTKNKTKKTLSELFSDSQAWTPLAKILGSTHAMESQRIDILLALLLVPVLLFPAVRHNIIINVTYLLLQLEEFLSQHFLMSLSKSCFSHVSFQLLNKWLPVTWR